MTASSRNDDARERRWLQALRDGRLDVFREIFDTHALALRHFAQIWVSRDVAEDAVQDVMFDVWQRREMLQPERGSLTAYLYAAVRKRVSHHLRHQSVVIRSEREHEPAVSGAAPPGMGVGPSQPDRLTETNDVRSALLAALAPLPELQRAVLVLRWVNDWPFARIADVLGISENAAKLHVSRGKQALYPVLRVLLDE